MINLNVKFLTDDYIASVAESFLKKNSLTSIPVNIEGVIEFNYRMDIVPTPGLLGLLDTDGYCSPDCTAIYVDQYVYERIYNRYRFTLAHELGHRVLHKHYFSELVFDSYSEWLKVMDQIDSWDYKKMEYQANMFAGMVLVPKEILRVEFNKQLQLIQSHLEQAKLNGISREDFLPFMTDAIANVLSRKFEVSGECLRIRIVFERLQEEIQ
jgi:hypothetical protein